MKRIAFSFLYGALVLLSSQATRAGVPLSSPVSGVQTSPRAASSVARMSNGWIMVSARLKIDPVSGDQKAIIAEQDAFIAHWPTAKVIGRTHHVLNSVFLAVSEFDYEELAHDTTVRRVTPVSNYRLDLSETVPYVGAAAVQSLGSDGAGVTVAVLDSGVDYLHKSLGGSGSVEAYNANDTTIIEPGSFPTAKVIGGYDFVGPGWPGTDLAPDADPLDVWVSNPGGHEGGHGTHVADIIAGITGVAPKASIYAIQVCSSVAASCAGIPLIQAMDFAADPNGDGDTSDHVDIINMSLGSNYGQPFDDDLTLAVENATRLGILTVSSAGNGGDRPFVTGTPSAASSAISVAQTQIPSAVQDFVNITGPIEEAGSYRASHQDWSPRLTESISGTVQYGDGNSENLDGCLPFPEGTLSGKIVMVDRGTCFFSDKIRNLEIGGAAVGIIGLINDEEPFSGSFGGGDPISLTTGFMISQAVADVLRTGTANVTFDPGATVHLAGSMVTTSSRGPRIDSAIKPEIGAPGASISALAGSGTDATPFGGTSGASPMVAGAAALLLSKNPNLEPWQIKAQLMNYAQPQISQDYTGVLTSVSRIGAGELDVKRAFMGKSLAYDPTTQQAKIDFGYVPVTVSYSTVKKLRIENHSSEKVNYTIKTQFRNEEDEKSEAVRFHHPRSVSIAARSSKTIGIKVRVYAEALPDNRMSAGASAADPTGLNTNEYDGYFVIESSTETLSVPWYMLPRKSSNLTRSRALRFSADGTARTKIVNKGMGIATNEAFTLLALSERLPPPSGPEDPTIDLKAVGVRTSPVPAAVCGPTNSFVIEVAFHLWETSALPIPLIQQVNIDLTGDGVTDYRLFNGDFNLLDPLTPGIDGRNVSFVADPDSFLSAFFFVENATNTKNTVLTACAEQLGLTSADFGTKEVSMAFETYSAFFDPADAEPRDRIEPVKFVLGAERYTAEVEDVEPYEVGYLEVTDHGTEGPNLGILLLTNSDRGEENRGGATPETEALIFSPSREVLSWANKN